MILPVDWLPEAIDEAHAARQRYAQVNRALARRFSAELKSAEMRIAEMPQATSPGDHGTRFVVLKTFPYVVHFRFDANRLEILAVSHAHRHPEYWHTRLS